MAVKFNNGVKKHSSTKYSFSNDMNRQLLKPSECYEMLLLMYLLSSHNMWLRSLLHQNKFSKQNCNTFDPLGFLSPFVTGAKILMQTAWICDAGWDDSLPEDLAARMISWFTKLQRLPETKCLQLKEGVS